MDIFLTLSQINGKLFQAISEIKKAVIILKIHKKIGYAYVVLKFLKNCFKILGRGGANVPSQPILSTSGACLI